MEILVTLVRLDHLPAKKADVVLVLDGGLDGYQLTGFQVWTGREDPSVMNVTFPARSYGKAGAGGAGFYTYLRPVAEGDRGEALKAAIVAAYHVEVSKGEKPILVPPSTKAAPKPIALVDPRGLREPRTAADLAAAAAAPGLAAPVPGSAAAIALAALAGRLDPAAPEVGPALAKHLQVLAPAPAAKRGRGRPRKAATAPEAPAPAIEAPAPPAPASEGRTAAQAAAWKRKPAWQKRKIWSGKGRRKGGAR